METKRRLLVLAGDLVISIVVLALVHFGILSAGWAAAAAGNLAGSAVPKGAYVGRTGSAGQTAGATAGSTTT